LLTQQGGTVLPIGKRDLEPFGRSGQWVFGVQSLLQSFTVRVGQAVPVQPDEGSVQPGASLQQSGFFADAQGHSACGQALTFSAVGMVEDFVEGAVRQAWELAGKGLRCWALRLTMALLQTVEYRPAAVGQMLSKRVVQYRGALSVRGIAKHRLHRGLIHLRQHRLAQCATVEVGAGDLDLNLPW
jgi:hypothetical protein